MCCWLVVTIDNELVMMQQMEVVFGELDNNYDVSNLCFTAGCARKDKKWKEP